MPGVRPASALPRSSATWASNLPGPAGTDATLVTRAGSLRSGWTGTLAVPFRPDLTRYTSFSSTVTWTTSGRDLTTVRNTSSGETVACGTILRSVGSPDHAPLWNRPWNTTPSIGA